MSQFGPKLKLCFELLILVPSSPHIRRCKRQKRKARKTKDMTNMRMHEDCKILAKISRLELFSFVSSVIDKSWETERLQPLYFLFLMRWWGWGMTIRMMTRITNSKIVLSNFNASWVSSLNVFFSRLSWLYWTLIAEKVFQSPYFDFQWCNMEIHLYFFFFFKTLWECWQWNNVNYQGRPYLSL